MPKFHPVPFSATVTQRSQLLSTLEALRPMLLEFHQVLLDAQKQRYEQQHGPVQTRLAYFQLVVEHGDFQWLRPISKTIVQLDEVIRSRRPQPDENIEAAMAAVVQLVGSEDTGLIASDEYNQTAELNPRIKQLQTKMLSLLAS